MKRRLDFTEIPSDGDRFEAFTEELLEALGWVICVRHGKGPDGGKDIIAEKTTHSASGRVINEKWVIQCKHNAHGGDAVGPSKLGDITPLPAKFSANGWLLVTSTQITSSLADNLPAYRSTAPGKDFDAWNAEDIERRLIDNINNDKFRHLARRYFPISFQRMEGALVPTRAEVRDMFHKLVNHYPSYGAIFTNDQNSETNLQADFLSLRVNLSAIHCIIEDASLNHEFINIWSAHLGKDIQQVSSLLLFRGLYRLFQLTTKNLPSTGRAMIIAMELRNYVLYREAQRRTWKSLTIYSGSPLDWHTIIDSKTVVLPPFPLSNVHLKVYCSRPDSAAILKIRSKEHQEFTLCANYTHELDCVLAFQTPAVPGSLGLEMKLEPGSDPVDVVCVGYKC